MPKKELGKTTQKDKTDKFWNNLMTDTWAGDLIQRDDDLNGASSMGMDIPVQNGVNLVGVHCLRCFELTENFLQSVFYACRLEVDKNQIIQCRMCDFTFYIKRSWSSGVTSIDYYDLNNNLIYEGGY